VGHGFLKAGFRFTKWLNFAFLDLLDEPSNSTGGRNLCFRDPLFCSFYFVFSAFPFYGRITTPTPSLWRQSLQRKGQRNCLTFPSLFLSRPPFRLLRLCRRHRRGNPLPLPLSLRPLPLFPCPLRRQLRNPHRSQSKK
jgi:hypothetical protein